MGKEGGATHLFKGDYCKVGDSLYSLYFKKGWKVSASVTNEQLLKEGSKIRVKDMLKIYLMEVTKDKSVISAAALKRRFPENREDIKTYLFVGLLEPVSQEYPDSVRAFIY